MAIVQIYLPTLYANQLSANTLIIQNFSSFNKQGLYGDFTENCWIMGREHLFCD